MSLKVKFSKVTLIAAQQVSFSEQVHLYLCLGVITLAASLRQRGIDCEVIDLAEFHHLHNSDFDEVFESIINKIIASQPDILGFSAMGNNLPFALELSERIKKRFPGIFIVFGGPGPSFVAKEILAAFPQVDAIIRGEADVTFPDFVELFSSTGSIPEVKGLVYRNGDRLIDYGWADPIENLDNLSIPPIYELWTENIRDENLAFEYRSLPLEVGRGCPYNCYFCASSYFFKRKFRLKSVDIILKEIRYIRENIGNIPLIFYHDLLTLDHSYMEQLCEGLRQQEPGLVWKCYARLDTLNEAILKKMREAGCEELLIGIEVGTERMQRMINKNLDLTRFDDIMNILKKLDYRVHLFFIVGFPFEEPADIISLFSLFMKARLLFRNNSRCVLETLMPEKMTPLYESWKHTLAYDEYGCFLGINFIPASWGKLRQMIKEYPGIFYPYYHYRISDSMRLDSIKYVLLSIAFNHSLKNSSLLAYMARGDKFTAEIVNNTNRIELPSMESIENDGYFTVMDSFRRLFYDLLLDDPVLAGKFDALARCELELIEMSKQASAVDMKVIEVYYDPIKLMTALEAGTWIPDESENRDILYCILMWDEEEQKIKSTTISKALAENFLNKDFQSP